MKRLGVAPYILAALSFVFISCSSEDSDDAPNNRIVISTTPNESTAIDAANDFGTDLFRQVCKSNPESNVVMSPLSASLSLSMAANGASDDALSQLISILYGSDISLSELNALNSKFLDVLPKADRKTNLRLFNSAWIKDTYTASESVKSDLQKFYSAEFSYVDFAKTEGIAKINNWVREKSDNMINEIFDKPQIDMTFCLVNIMNFTSTWSIPFNKSDTKSSPFYGTKGMRKVDMMHIQFNKSGIGINSSKN